MSEKTMREQVTPAQARAVDAYCDHGCRKSAAQSLCVSEFTMDCHMRNVRRRLGYHGADIRLFLRWDRERRAEGSA